MRERQFNLLAGVRGAGKSTFLANWVKKYNENVIVLKHPSTILDNAFSFLPEKTTSNWRQGAAPGNPVKCKIAMNKGKEYKEFCKWAMDNYRNGALIVDDATIYEKSILTPEMDDLIAICRHVGIDLWMVYHGISRLPIGQFIWVNYIVLFNTTDNFEYKGSRIPEVPLIQRCALQARQNFKSKDIKIKYTPVIINLQGL